MGFILALAIFRPPLGGIFDPTRSRREALESLRQEIEEQQQKLKTEQDQLNALIAETDHRIAELEKREERIAEWETEIEARAAAIAAAERDLAESKEALDDEWIALEQERERLARWERNLAAWEQTLANQARLMVVYVGAAGLITLGSVALTIIATIRMQRMSSGEFVIRRRTAPHADERPAWSPMTTPGARKSHDKRPGPPQAA
jgi:DNA repair ATPase RecN